MKPFFIKIQDKEKYLKENYPVFPIPKLTDKLQCAHCGEIFIVENFRVLYKDGEEIIYCPNAPTCDGQVYDWHWENYDWHWED
jgi:hypothetical protein